jgi:hypothetical protein
MKRTVLALLAGSVISLMLWAVAGGALAANGNNGTVKVDGVPFDDLPNNEPHVGCVFQIDFYGYDAGQLFADVTFELDPPTGTQTLLLSKSGIFIGEDDASGGGSTAGLDASETFDLSAAIAASGEPPHSKQGWHIGLTVNADGSIGSDVKHKEFWVSGCGGYPPSVSSGSESGDGQLASDLQQMPTEPRPVSLGAAGIVALVMGSAFLILRRRLHTKLGQSK